MSNAYERITYKGFTFNRRTVAMLQWVEHHTGISLSFAQGSYSGGRVAASGTTHDGGGAVDVRSSVLTEAQRKKVVHAMKQAGFCVWYRGPGSGFSPHIHAIAYLDKQASSSARWQMSEYLAGRSGLTGRGADRTHRVHPQPVFNYRKKRPVQKG